MHKSPILFIVFEEWEVQKTCKVVSRSIGAKTHNPVRHWGMAKTIVDSLGLPWSTLQGMSLRHGNSFLNILLWTEISYREILHDGKPLSHLFSNQTGLLGALP